MITRTVQKLRLFLIQILLTMFALCRVVVVRSFAEETPMRFDGLVCLRYTDAQIRGKCISTFEARLCLQCIYICWCWYVVYALSVRDNALNRDGADGIISGQHGRTFSHVTMGAGKDW